MKELEMMFEEAKFEDGDTEQMTYKAYKATMSDFGRVQIARCSLGAIFHVDAKRNPK